MIRGGQPNQQVLHDGNMDQKIKELLNMHNLPSISMINVELYCDGNYPRGISILYQIEGQKSLQLNYIDQVHKSEVLRKDSFSLNQNEMISRIDLWKKDNCLVKVVITKAEKKQMGQNRGNFSRTMKNQISAGCGRLGVKYTVQVPDSILEGKKKLPLIFCGSYIDGYPFPRLIDIGLQMLINDEKTGKFSFKKIDPVQTNTRQSEDLGLSRPLSTLINS